MERMAVLFRSNSGATPNPVKGFYTALAMCLPLLVLTMLGQSAFGVLVMTGALLTSFVDLGTSSRTQAWSLGMTAVGGALMTALGRLIGGPWWVEVVEIFLVVFIGGLLSVYGRALAVMGLLLTIPFVSSLANRSGPVTARPAAGGTTECRCGIPGCAAGRCSDCRCAERFGVRADRRDDHVPGIYHKRSEPLPVMMLAS